jgi:acyl dehydratase
MAHKLVIHKPIDPMGAKLTIEDVVTEIFDRGSGKGCVVRSELTAYDTSGEKVFTNIGDTLFAIYSAQGSPLYPKSEVDFPDREPDFVERDHIASNQNLIYRMSGDTNRLHVDINEAHVQGFKKPIMQGLCSFGYVCRTAIKDLIPNEPERMKSMEAQIRSPLDPGTDIEIRLWKVDDCKAYFKVINVETNQTVLEKGMFTWK